MVQMRMTWFPAVVFVGLVAVSGCGSGGSDGSGGGKTAAPSVSTTAAAVSIDEAMREYQRAAAPGCSDAPGCQQSMTEELAALADLKTALVAEDPARWAPAIHDIERAERQADIYGRDNLGAKGNALAVTIPMERAVSYVASSR